MTAVYADSAGSIFAFVMHTGNNPANEMMPAIYIESGTHYRTDFQTAGGAPGYMIDKIVKSGVYYLGAGLPMTI